MRQAKRVAENTKVTRDFIMDCRSPDNDTRSLKTSVDKEHTHKQTHTHTHTHISACSIFVIDCLLFSLLLNVMGGIETYTSANLVLLIALHLPSLNTVVLF